MEVRGLWNALREDKHTFQTADELDNLLREYCERRRQSSATQMNHNEQHPLPHMLIDGMAIFMAVWHRDGFGSRTFQAKGNTLATAAVDLGQAMMDYIVFLPNQCEKVWVFDGLSTEIAKAKHVWQAKQRAKMLSKAIRLQYASRKPYCALQSKKILNRFAKPTKHFVQMTLDALDKTLKLNVLIASGEADFTIAGMVRQLAAENKTAIVVSPDSD